MRITRFCIFHPFGTSKCEIPIFYFPQSHKIVFNCSINILEKYQISRISSRHCLCHRVRHIYFSKTTKEIEKLHITITVGTESNFCYPSVSVSHSKSRSIGISNKIATISNSQIQFSICSNCKNPTQKICAISVSGNRYWRRRSIIWQTDYSLVRKISKFHLHFSIIWHINILVNTRASIERLACT